MVAHLSRSLNSVSGVSGGFHFIVQCGTTPIPHVEVEVKRQG